MFGLLFGTLCLLGLVAVVARGRRRYRHFYGYGHHGHHGHWGPRSAVNAVLARLDTAPGQEKVIVAAVEEFVDRTRESGKKVRETRAELAGTLRGERVDDARLSDVFQKHDTVLSEVRTAAVDALHKVHEALDERQRKLLADLLESGGYFGFRRHAHAC